MKTNIFYILIVLFAVSVFAEGTENNYNNGNGTIVEQKVEDNKQITIRKHEDRLELFSVVFDEAIRANGVNELVILDKPQINANVVFIIPEYPVVTYINTILFRYEKSLYDDKNNSWLYVKTDDGNVGWLYLGISFDPYEDGTWTFLEKITIQNRIWTVRKFVGSFFVWETLDVRDKPGIIGTNILFKIQNDNHLWLGINILAITEEKDTIDGETDYWVKIKDDKNRIGWLFGGYGDVTRGGPKYRIPDASIRFEYAFP